MGKMENKVVLLYGAASGMAKATAVLLAKEGAKVVLADLNYEGAKAVAEEIRAAGGQAAAVACNALKAEEIEGAVTFAVETFGCLNGMLYQPGDNVLAPIAQIEKEKWDFQLALNLTGPMWAIRYAAGQMAQNGGGSIIITSSLNSTVPCAGYAAYCATKGGVDQLARVAALEYGAVGVRVNTINPGFINTPIIAAFTAFDDIMQIVKNAQCNHSRIGEPEDFAKLALFLLSDDSAFITAGNIKMDGGLNVNGYPDVIAPLMAKVASGELKLG